MAGSLESRHPADAVVLGGTAEVPERPVAGHWGVPTERVQEQDWEPAGWLTSTGRGRWDIRGPHVVPLLVVIVAATAR